MSSKDIKMHHTRSLEVYGR